MARRLPGLHNDHHHEHARDPRNGYLNGYSRDLCDENHAQWDRRIWLAIRQQLSMQRGAVSNRLVHAFHRRQVRGRRPKHLRGQHRLLAQVVPRPEGRIALEHSILLLQQERLVREQYRPVETSARGHFAKGYRQHDLDFVPLLHPIDADDAAVPSSPGTEKGQLFTELPLFCHTETHLYFPAMKTTKGEKGTGARGAPVPR